jgi:hypothetical protein
MATQRLSENLISISIVPKRVRWPEPGVAAVWTKANECVDALQDLVRKTDIDCLQIEQNAEFSTDAIRKRRSEICDQAMAKLVSFKTFGTAEKALINDIELLNGLSVRSPEQVQMHAKLKQAIQDLREGVEATRRMLQERCKVRERASV